MYSSRHSLNTDVCYDINMFFHTMLKKQQQYNKTESPKLICGCRITHWLCYELRINYITSIWTIVPCSSQMRGSALNSDFPPTLSSCKVYFGLIGSFKMKEILICWFSHLFSSANTNGWAARPNYKMDQTNAWSELTAVWHAFTTKYDDDTAPLQLHTATLSFFLFLTAKTIASRKFHVRNFSGIGLDLSKTQVLLDLSKPTPLPSRHYISHYPLNLIITARVPALDLRMAMGLR